MAPRGRNLAAAAGPANSASNLPQSEAIRSPPLQPVSIPSQTLPQVSPRPEIASASSSRSNKSRRSNQSNRSRTKGNSQLQDQLRAQALELAELRLLLLRQQEQRSSTLPQGNLPRQITPHIEPDHPLESVEDIGSRRESHFIPSYPQPSANFRPVLRHSAESDYPELERYRKPRITDPKQLDDGTEPTWISWSITVENKLEQDSFQFETERSKIAYVYGCTKGQANALLTPRMKKGCVSPFTSIEEMFQLLSDMFTNPAEKEEAIEEF